MARILKTKGHLLSNARRSSNSKTKLIANTFYLAKWQNKSQNLFYVIIFFVIICNNMTKVRE